MYYIVDDETYLKRTIVSHVPSSMQTRTDTETSSSHIIQTIEHTGEQLHFLLDTYSLNIAGSQGNVNIISGHVQQGGEFMLLVKSSSDSTYHVGTMASDKATIKSQFPLTEVLNPVDLFVWEDRIYVLDKTGPTLRCLDASGKIQDPTKLKDSSEPKRMKLAQDGCFLVLDSRGLLKYRFHEGNTDPLWRYEAPGATAFCVEKRTNVIYVVTSGHDQPLAVDCLNSNGNLLYLHVL